MKLEINQQTMADPATPENIAALLRALPAEDEAIITLWKNESELLQAGGVTSDGFILNYQNTRTGADWSSANRALKLPTIIRVLTSFAREENDWRRVIQWEGARTTPRWAKWFDIPPGLAALVIFSCLGLPVIAYAMMQGEPGAPQWLDLLKAFGAIAAIAGYIQYIDLFFRVIRPRIAIMLATMLGVEIAEAGMPKFSVLFGKTADAEDWTVKQTAGLGVRVLVFVLDAAITIIGVIGPVAIICIPAFLILDALGF